MKIVDHHNEQNPYRRELVKNLVAYNDAHGPAEKWRFIGFYAIDDEGKLAGGVQGNFEWDILHIAHLWVRESGKGLGGELIRKAEEVAITNKMTAIQLDTFGFQAKDFYEKMGFEVFGTIPNAAGPHPRFFLVKKLPTT